MPFPGLAAGAQSARPGRGPSILGPGADRVEPEQATVNAPKLLERPVPARANPMAFRESGRPHPQLACPAAHHCGSGIKIGLRRKHKSIPACWSDTQFIKGQQDASVSNKAMQSLRAHPWSGSSCPVCSQLGKQQRSAPFSWTSVSPCMPLVTHGHCLCAAREWLVPLWTVTHIFTPCRLFGLPQTRAARPC